MSATSITSSPSSSCNWIGLNDTILSHKISSNDNTNTTSFDGNDLDNLSNNVDDGLTSLTWLQNLNMCMTRLGAPTPPTPPASPVSFNFASNTTNTTICKVRLQSQKERGQTTNQHHHHHHKQQQSSSNKKVNNNLHHNHSNDIAIIALESSLSSSQQSKSHIILANDDHHKNNNDNNNNNKQQQQQQQQKIESTTIVQKTKSTESNGQSKSEKTSKNSSKKCSANRKSICPKSSSSSTNNGVGKKNSNIADNHPLTDNNNNNNNSHTQNSFNLQHSQIQPEESVDYKLNGNIKPPFSYATLICMAMKANKNKMTLSAIYKWIKENFLYYRQADPSWQNSIRHNLSLNKCFIKIARNKDEPGKGGFWKLDPIYADSLIDGIFKKRRPNSSNSNTSSNNNKSQHKIENGGNTGAGGSIKKKPRKKRSTTNMMTTMANNNNNNQNPNNNDFYIGYIEANDNHYHHHQTTHQQETPPSSAESCAFKEHKMIDINELNQAINNIDSNHNHHHHCTYTTYSTFPSGNILDCTGSAGSTVGDSNLHGFSNEICIGQNSNNESCIIETTDANDLCWNTILTDVDLSELVDPIHYSDSVTQIINPVENDNDSSITNHSHHRHHHHESNKNSDNVIESNNMELTTMVDANDTNNSLLDDQQLFYHHEGQLHNLTGFVQTPAHNNQIISTTPNVVTCINDTNLTVDHWNWSTFPNTVVDDGSTSMQIECSNSNELILNPIVNPNSQQEVIMNEITNLLTSDDVNNLTYVTTSTANAKQSTLTTTINPTTTATTMTQQTNNNNNDIIVVINDSNQQQQQESPTNNNNNNFDANNSVWDCKTTPNLDASGALELDNFNNQLDQLHQF